MKKLSFKTTYWFFSAGLTLIVIILLLSVYRILANYENSQAKYFVEDYVSVMQEAIDTRNPDTIVAFNMNESSTRFVSKEALSAYFISVCSGKTLSYEASPKSFDVNNPVYNISCDGNLVATLQLRLLSEKKKLGFLSIPEWELNTFSVATDAFTSAYTISLPIDFSIKANGILLDETDIVSTANDICAYYVEGFISEPILEITDSFGTKAQTGPLSVLSEANHSAKVYSVPVDYERFDFAVPADFSVSITNNNASCTHMNGYNVYSIYTAEPATNEFLVSHVQAADAIGNPLTFRKFEGKLLPVYTEYSITAADCYRVFADDQLLNPASVEFVELSAPQYTDTPLSLATYNIGLAKEVTFKVLDKHDVPVDFEINGTALNVPLFDCTVTIPDNFNLLINGMAPECVPSSADNTDYLYVAEFADVPQLLTYHFEGLAKAPTFTVTDNLGNPVHYLLTKGGELTITEQAVLAELPESLSSQVDPLEIAKTWSLYMTDDLEGSLNGYYTMRKYLIRDSYYDTVAYQWATNIDISFISNHYFNDPPFSSESVKNVVLYGDNCFSCDIYFIKHMILTRTGKLQDDVFNRRMYFVYTDDTDDNIDNPHWTICDMQEI